MIAKLIGLLTAPLRAALSSELAGDDAAANGGRFLAAIVDESFDLHGYDYLNIRDYEPQAVENAYGGLLRSLPGGGADETLEEVG